MSNKYKKLKKEGWKVGSVKDFLGLSDEEVEYIETKLTLTRYLKKRRRGLGYTQTELANRLGTSQSRIAKMEAGDASVSIDSILRAIFSLNVSKEKVAKAIRKK